MLRPVELRAGGGTVLIGPLAIIPAARRGMQSPLAALARIFQDRDAVAQLRREWAKLDVGGGHHQLLSPTDMHALLERAIALHRIALLWIPAVSHHAIHVTVPPKPPPPPPAIPGAPARQEVKPPAVPVGTMAIPAKIERALVQSFDYIARDGKKGLKEFVAAIDALRRDPVAMAKIVAFCALLAVPVVGEAAAGAFLAYAYYLLGFHGTLAALHFGAACVRAAAATTDAEIDTAAREFADAFEDLGEAVIAWLITRIQPMSSVGARSAAAEKEASLVARAETQAAKVVKQGESYQTQVLSKYKEAKEEAKAALDEAVAAGKKELAEQAKALEAEGLGKYGYLVDALPPDLVADARGVYGYMPVEGSQFSASKWAVDWADAEAVAAAREIRMAYHEGIAAERAFVDKLAAEGVPTDEIGRQLVDLRNTNRLAAYAEDRLPALYERNLKAYGNALGPTYESQLAKYGSAEAVIEAALRTNKTMDILTGIARVK